MKAREQAEIMFSKHELVANQLGDIFNKKCLNDLTCLLEYNNNLKEMLQDPSFFVGAKNGRNRLLLENCLCFMCDMHFPKEIDIAKQSVLYEIKFILTKLELELLKCSARKDGETLYNLRCTLVDIAGEGAEIWVKTEEYYKASAYLRIALGTIEENLQEGPGIIFQTEQSRKFLEFKKGLLFLYQAQIHAYQDRLDETVEIIQRFRDQFMDFHLYEKLLANICAKLSLVARDFGRYDMATYLLNCAYDIGKHCELNKYNIGIILKLLADSYLKSTCHDGWQNALHALDQACAEKVDCYCIEKMLEAYVASKRNPSVEKFVKRAVVQKQLDNRTVLKMVFLLKDSKYHNFVLEVIQAYRDKYEGSSFCVVADIFSLLLKTYFKSESCDLAKSTIEEFLNILSSTEEISPQGVYFVLETVLQYAVEKFHCCSYAVCIVWYECCISLLKKIEGVNEKEHCELMCCIQEQICLCHVKLHQLDKAEDALIQLKKMKACSLMVAYLSLKIGVLSENEKLSSEALLSLDDIIKEMGRQDYSPHDTVINPVSCIHSCYKSAYKMGNSSFMERILECYLLIPADKCSRDVYIAAYRCLTRIYMENFGKSPRTCEKFLNHLDKVHSVLDSFQEENPLDGSKTKTDTSNWLSAICWRMSEQDDVAPKLRFELMLYCWSWLEYAGCPDVSKLILLKIYVLLSASFGLSAARHEGDSHCKHDILNKVFIAIEKYKDITLEEFSQSYAGKALEHLLLLCEFEARAQYVDPQLEEIFKRALTMHELEAISFETMSAFSYESGLLNYEITVGALKVAITKHLQNSEPDYTRISQDYRHILMVLFTVEEHIRPEVLNDIEECCGEIKGIISERADDCYPQLEVLWILCRCWNRGLEYFLECKKTSRRFCTIAVSFVQLLQSLKSLYDKRLAQAYRSLFFESRDSIKQNSSKSGYEK